MTHESGWYADPESECPECRHGPKWHNDIDGCTRMNGPWCECPRTYGPDATGPDDYTSDDGADDHGDHLAESDPTCPRCRELYDAAPAADGGPDVGDIMGAEADYLTDCPCGETYDRRTDLDHEQHDPEHPNAYKYAPVMMGGRDARDADGNLPAYAWPGGYPIIYLTRDGLTLCPACANDADTSDPVVAGDVYWEGPALICDDAGETIESAYGDPDAGDDNEPTEEYASSYDHEPHCPACGEHIDYCQGHGIIGDADGARRIAQHDDGDHSDCHPAGCGEAPSFAAE